MNYWKKYKYKNLTLFLLSILYAFLLMQYKGFHDVLLSFLEFEYLSALLAGVFFVFTFTMPTATVMVLILAEKLSPSEIAYIAGIGSVLGDLIIFRAVKHGLIDELTPIYHYLGGKHLTSIIRTKYFAWFLPVMGAIIFASPLPDELGVSILGIAKMKTYKFAILSYVFNTLSVYLIVKAKLILAG